MTPDELALAGSGCFLFAIALGVVALVYMFRVPARRQTHRATVHLGDWHRFAVCTTCFWQGDRTGVHSSRYFVQDAAAQAHELHVSRRYWVARILHPFRVQVTHHAAGISGSPLRCCGRDPLAVSGVDRFTFDEREVTCQ